MSEYFEENCKEYVFCVLESTTGCFIDKMRRYSFLTYREEMFNKMVYFLHGDKCITNTLEMRYVE